MTETQLLADVSAGALVAPAALLVAVAVVFVIARLAMAFRLRAGMYSGRGEDR